MRAVLLLQSLGISHPIKTLGLRDTDPQARARVVHDWRRPGGIEL